MKEHQSQFYSEENLSEYPETSYRVDDAIQEYFVIQGGVPLDVYQRAELTTLKDTRLGSLQGRILDVVSPYTQALHATAFLQSKFFQEQETLKNPIPTDRNRNSIHRRLSRLIKRDPKRIDRVGTWTNKVGDNYYGHELKFHEDLEDPDIRDRIVLDQYEAKIAAIRDGDPFASVTFKYNPGNQLTELVLSRIECKTQLFQSAVTSKAARDAVQDFAHPRSNPRFPDSEIPKLSSSRFLFRLSSNPFLDIFQIIDSYDFERSYIKNPLYYIPSTQSAFVFESSSNIFIRQWVGNADRIGAERAQLSTTGELSIEEYLNILQGMLIIPLKNIKELTLKR